MYIVLNMKLCYQSLCLVSEMETSMLDSSASPKRAPGGAKCTIFELGLKLNCGKRNKTKDNTIIFAGRWA